MSGVIEMASKYAGRCHVCKQRYEVDETVLMNPPKGGRKRWLVRHTTCRPRHTFGTEGAWRKNAEWMTPAEYEVMRQVMAKQAPTG